MWSHGYHSPACYHIQLGLTTLAQMLAYVLHQILQQVAQDGLQRHFCLFETVIGLYSNHLIIVFHSCLLFRDVAVAALHLRYENMGQNISSLPTWTAWVEYNKFLYYLKRNSVFIDI